ncbi:mitochondrial carrier [Mycena galericulata]|nr:mitochondrial carrier [Mycena galericulata]
MSVDERVRLGGRVNKLHAGGLVAGFASGITKVAVGHGFDTVKTRVQLNPVFGQGAFHVLKTTIRREGFTALYKGATPPAVGWAAIDSLLLGSLHHYRLFLLHNGMTEDPTGTAPPRLTLFAHGAAGFLAGLTSAPLATPFELLKVRLQLQMQKSVSDRQFKGPIDCARQLVRSQGVAGLWTGLSGGLLYRANFFYMFFAFEACMRGLSNLDGTPYEPSVGIGNLISGGLASLCFWTMAIPFDRTKNQMMSHPYPRPYPESPSSRRPSFISVARQIHANEGLKGFYRGLAPCFIRAFPANACAFFVYEGILRALGAEQTR